MPPRMIVLKGRQLGSSTFCQAYSFWKAMKPNTTCMCIAHDLESTTRIFEMAKFFYENLPTDVRPMKRYSNRKELVLENPDERTRPMNPGLRSKIEIRTAGNVGSGKGLTLHVLHASEVAMYEQPDLVWSSLTPAVPYNVESAIFIESTAHLMGQWFRDFWFRSKRGETGYTPIFLPWYLAPEYSLDGVAKEIFLSREVITEEERDLMRRFDLSEGQMAWRRSKIDELRGSVDLFRQDYPLTDEEAFIAVGSPLLPYELIDALRAQAFPGVSGEMVGRNFTPSPKGRLQVWKPPREDKYYVIGVDTSQGAEGSDPACIQVVEGGPVQEQVACWHGRIGAIEMAEIVEALAVWYNHALVAPEVNNTGISLLTTLRERGVVTIYRWRYLDRTGSGITPRYGWFTTPSSKPTLISSFRHQIASGKLKIYDPETLSELRTFVIDARGSAAAAPGRDDDRLMALAIASICDILDGGVAGWSTKQKEPEQAVGTLDPIHFDLLPGLDGSGTGTWKTSV
jgi:hypothetical protein